MNQENLCVQSMYLRPSGDIDKAILVLDTNLEIEAGKPCSDMPLGDLLVALEDMMELGRHSRADVDMIEIRGSAH